jgi:hypothetical protein
VPERFYDHIKSHASGTGNARTGHAVRETVATGLRVPDRIATGDRAFRQLRRGCDAGRHAAQQRNRPSVDIGHLSAPLVHALRHLPDAVRCNSAAGGHGHRARDAGTIWEGAEHTRESEMVDHASARECLRHAFACMRRDAAQMPLAMSLERYLPARLPTESPFPTARSQAAGTRAKPQLQYWQLLGKPTTN